MPTVVRSRKWAESTGMYTSSRLTVASTSLILLGARVHTWLMELVWLGRLKDFGVKGVPPSRGWYSLKEKFRRRNCRRCRSGGFMSTDNVALRWFWGWGAVRYQSWLPLMALARFGAGYAFRMPIPLGLSCDLGMMFSAIGLPVTGSFN